MSAPEVVAIVEEFFKKIVALIEALLGKKITDVIADASAKITTTTKA